ncbi:M15 family metallopeptidase [Flavobacterium sp.]|uniref:M15 family metallopeptidase n=1 Tax=Flavobacterium sp. TaxID=239 RepID=UPI0012060520|nr:M15 family metallopeptidase [Flavobacterium sp.]RZJ72815.1 MAG: peptidase M15 [Flavobacterium sp.]
MRFSTAFFVLISVFSIVCCKSNQQPFEGVQPQDDIIATTNDAKIGKAKKIEMPAIPDTTFVDLKNYSRDFVYDIKYATSDNFLKSQVYDCAECYLRLKTVQALLAANQDFIKIGYRIKIYDCYRPLDIQKRMWKIVPNPSYVANPKTGSIHNRGGAVDISLVDSEGKELDMGTKFDHFGPEAAIDYINLSEQVKNNRKLLQEIMSQHRFSVLKSEWWHFNFAGASQEKVSNFRWDCD